MSHCLMVQLNATVAQFPNDSVAFGYIDPVIQRSQSTRWYNIYMVQWPMGQLPHGTISP